MMYSFGYAQTSLMRRRAQETADMIRMTEAHIHNIPDLHKVSFACGRLLQAGKAYAAAQAEYVDAMIGVDKALAETKKE